MLDMFHFTFTFPLPRMLGISMVDVLLNTLLHLRMQGGRMLLVMQRPE
uniref:Uncharacterized protein n=1 Tax=Arundo donax TaxID=35708 RepID=A0A0A8Z189_ARUDO